MMKRFLSDDSGAVTVDWVVLAAGVVGLGIASVGAVQIGTSSLGSEIDTQLAAAGVTIPFLRGYSALVSEDFENGMPAGWHYSQIGTRPDNWSVSNGELGERSDAGHGFMAYDMGQDSDLTEYRVSADIDATGSYNNGVGLVFGAQDEDNYYLARWLHFGDGYDNNSQHQHLQVVQVVNGVSTVIGSAGQVSLGNQFNMSATVGDNGISIAIDGTERLTVAGEQPPLNTIGLYTYDNDNGVSYDNVQVLGPSDAG